jgi:AcrR family transcriptional regulator
MSPQRHNTVAAPLSTGRDVPPAILAATRECVLAVGVRRTTLTDVARRAGVSRMTVYRLVPDVTTLILEVITREFVDLLASAERGARRRRTARGRLVTASVEVVRRLPAEPLFERVLDVDPELLLPYLTDRLGSTQQIAVGHVRRMLAEGIADGSVRAGELEPMALAFVLAVTPFAVSARLVPPAGRAAVLDELTHLLDGWLRP